MFTELLQKANCKQDDKTFNYLNEYFEEYEKENQMEEFLGKNAFCQKVKTYKEHLKSEGIWYWVCHSNNFL